MPGYHRVVIVGVGLLGGSVGLALRQRGLATSIIGVGRNVASLQQAVARGAITDYAEDLSVACRGADLVVVGTPVQSIADFVKNCFATKLATDCLVTDVGSTKSSICRQLAGSEFAQFCGSHPMAGGEKTGVAHASADLFLGKRTIITPTAQTSAQAVERTDQLWRSMDSDVVRMTPDEHDRTVANVSHLPHIVASALASTTDSSLIPFAASGWGDTTRVASGDVEMWRQIISENREPILSALRVYSQGLSQWLSAIESGDQTAIVSLLESGKTARDSAVVS